MNGYDRILEILGTDPMPTHEICDKTGISPSCVRTYLSHLKKRGLVQVSRCIQHKQHPWCLGKPQIINGWRKK